MNRVGQDAQRWKLVTIFTKLKDSRLHFKITDNELFHSMKFYLINVCFIKEGVQSECDKRCVSIFIA